MATESSKMNAEAAHDQNHDDPETIRAEMRRTRDDMSETLSAIQEKLNPERIREQAVDSVRRATIGRVEDVADDVTWKVKGAGNDVFETIKHNPAPAVLAAVGLGWLFMESRGRSNDREMRRFREGRGLRDRYYADERYGRGGYDYGYSYDEYGRRSTGYGEPGFREYEQQRQGMGERASEAVSQTTGKVQDAARQAGAKVQGVAEQATGTVQDVAESAKETAGQVVDSARYGVQQVAQEAQYRAERVGSRFGDMMQDNPLVIGAAAMALGALVGFAFPSTEKENEIIGPARDRVMDRAQEVASETAEKVQHVAQEATSAAKDAAKNEAQRQNLTSSGSGY